MNSCILIPQHKSNILNALIAVFFLDFKYNIPKVIFKTINAHVMTEE